MAKGTMTFPPDFLWGTATSSHQVEGNNIGSDWWAWEQEPDRILNNHKSGPACNWWENAEADLDQAAEMGNNAHRMSLEWSRIEPEPSVFDRDALDRYRQILQAMIDRDIDPMVTLHHFSNPMWLVEKGDFNSDIVIEYFQRYTSRVIDSLGDLVSKWITINEPLIYFYMRYMGRAFPSPSRHGLLGGFEAVRQMLRCHAAAYHTIKDKYPQAEVGVAKSMPVFEGITNGNFLDNWLADRADYFFNRSWMQSMVDGKIRWPYGRGRMRHLAGSFDFVGINYYTRYKVKFPPRHGFFENNWDEDAVVSDGNYGEVYPYGLYQSIKAALSYNKPIYITENGLPDKEDKLRPAFILDHLRQIWHAISFCYPVMGYYHWSLTDNFEWDRGWAQRFGLISLDPETQARQWRPSAHLYAEICKNNVISSDMAQKYAPHLMPVMFPGQAGILSNSKT